MESAKILAKIARMLRNVGLAEEIAQDAWLAALEQWDKTGIPDNPGAWLMAAAKNRAIDELRRRKMQAQKHEAIEDGASGLPRADADFATAIDENVGDDLLRLVLIACHPVLSRD